MADDDSNEVMVAVETHACEIDGVPQMAYAGVTRVKKSHALYKQNPQYWRPVEDRLTYMDNDVEDATANPGEKRGKAGSEPAASAAAPTEPESGNVDDQQQKASGRGRSSGRNS